MSQTPFTTFDAYLATLPPEWAAHGAALRQRLHPLAMRPANADLTPFIFLPGPQTHPDHEDADEVFVIAVEQMALPKPWVGEEIPLCFLGFHVMNRLSGTRTAQGFLLTDQALYVQDDFSVLLTRPPAQAHGLPANTGDVDAFVSTRVAQFKEWKGWAALAQYSEEDLQSRLSVLLGSLVEAVVAFHAGHGSQRQPERPIWTLAKLIAEGDHDMLLDPSQPKSAKKLGKLAAKFQIPADETLQFALAEFPLFGGPYGLALTTRALYGKDLMEAPVRQALDTLDAGALRYADGDEKALLTGAGEPLPLPAYLPASLQAPFLVFLQQEILRLQSAA